MGVERGWVGVGWRVRGWGNREREGDWRAQHKGSYPPGSNTCHQLLPPSCAFIKKPPCALLGNPHALLKKCEVNTVCLSISLPLPSLSLHCSPFLPFCDVFGWAVERSPFSAWLCVFVCVCTCMFAHRVCQTLSVSSTQPRAKASIARGSACNVGRPASWTQAEYQRHTADTPPSSPPADLRDPNVRRRGV